MARDQAQLFYDCIPQENRNKLDTKLDADHDGVQKHLGEIANAMDEWEGSVAEALGLTKVDVVNIRSQHRDNVSLQTRAALQKWQEKNGFTSTYRNLIVIFLKAGKTSYAEAVCKVLGGDPSQIHGTPIRMPATTTRSTGTRLRTNTHYHDLYQFLAPYSNHWRAIGRALGFFPNELTIIQSNVMLMTQGSCGYLSDMITKWLQWAPGDGRGSRNFATYEDLIAALLKVPGTASIAYDLGPALGIQGGKKYAPLQPTQPPQPPVLSISMPAGTPGQTNGASVPMDTTTQHPSAGSKDQGNASTNQPQPNSSTTVVEGSEASLACPPVANKQEVCGTGDPFLMFIERCKVGDRDIKVLDECGITCNKAFAGSSEEDLLEMEDESGNKLTNGCINILKYYLLQQNACQEQVRSHDSFLKVVEDGLCYIQGKDKKILEENGFTCKEAFVGLSQQVFLEMKDSSSERKLTKGCTNIFKCHLLPHQDVRQKEVPKRVNPDGDQSGKDNAGQLTMDGTPNQDKSDHIPQRRQDSDLAKEKEVVNQPQNQDNEMGGSEMSRSQNQDEIHSENENFKGADLLPPTGENEEEEEEDPQNPPESDGWLKHSSYGPYSRKMKKDRKMPHQPELKLEGKSTKIETSEVQYPGDSAGPGVYRMKKVPHGVALIINNKKFKSHKERNGTKIDEDNLVETFRYLGYRVEIRRDCTKEDMEKLIDTIDTLMTDEDDSVVCCILSHGSDNVVYGSDSEEVILRGTHESSLEKKLAARCKSKLNNGQPKLFFVSTCREAKKTEQDKEYHKPELDGDRSRENFAFYYSTIPGESSTRYPDRGTVYIEKLCEVLCRSATKLTLSDIQKKVAGEMPNSQFPASEERLDRNIYFFDDLYSDRELSTHI